MHAWETWGRDRRLDMLQERCPSCGSARVAHLPRLRLFTIAAFVLLIAGVLSAMPVPFLLLAAIMSVMLALIPPHRCDDCRRRWRNHAAGPA